MAGREGKEVSHGSGQSAWECVRIARQERAYEHLRGFWDLSFGVVIVGPAMSANGDERLTMRARAFIGFGTR